MWNKFIKGNIELIEKLKNTSFSDRNAIKKGFFYRYLNHINNQTPENAIILMPPDSVLNSVDPKLKLDQLKLRLTTTYYIYPRRVVYEKHLKYDSLLMNKITHVAIVNYYGYEKLNYKIKNKSQFTILPIDIKQLKK